MEAHGVTRALVRVGLGMMAVPVLLYGVLLAINWRDEPPSDAALRLTAMLESRPRIDDAANGYVHLLGLALPRDVDALAIGAQRQRWLATYEGPAGTFAATWFPDGLPDTRASMTPEAKALVAACSDAPTDCTGELVRERAALDRWLASEAWRLERYRRMLATRTWRETVPRDWRAPTPGYAAAMHVQELHLLATHMRAVDGDAETVRAWLEADLAFWRGVVASADLLVTRRIAEAAVKRHFQHGTVALRALPPGAREAATPDAWRRPLDPRERSLMRALAGEWYHTTHSTRLLNETASDAPLGRRISSALMNPLWKRQASANRSAARHLAIGLASEAPRPQAEAELRRLSKTWSDEHRPFRAYDPLGHLVDGVSIAALYANRLEGPDEIERARLDALDGLGTRSGTTAMARPMHARPVITAGNASP